MKIKNFEIVDRCLFWKEKKILIVGDLHLGYEHVLIERGMSFPKTQMAENFRIFGEVFKKTGKLDKIILMGDVKHKLGGTLKGESEDFFNVVELFKKNLGKNGKIIIVKGNHDNFLEPIVRNYDGVVLVDYYILEDVLFFHGDRMSREKINGEILEKSKLIVVGHFHPAMEVKEDFKKEKYKCFLFGKSKDFKKEMIVVPSFFPLIEGVDFLKRSKPGFMQGLDVRNFEIVVLDGIGRSYEFGKVRKFI